MGGLESFELCYNLQPEDSWIDFAESCLSQAHHIFKLLEIGKDEWREYCEFHYGSLGMRVLMYS
jgi:hypothetical protein